MAKLKHLLGHTFYQSKGHKNKNIPLVALHGGPGGSSYGLRPLLKLSKERKVYIYDQIGGGRSSEIPIQKAKIETFVKDLDRLLRHWDLKQFYLFGASWGTTLALEYYLSGKYAKKIQGLIFQSPMFSASTWQKDALKLIAKLPPKTQKVIRYCHEIGSTDSKVYKEAVFSYYLKHVLRNKTKLRQKLPFKNHHGDKIYRHMWGPSEFKASGTLKNYSRLSKLKSIKVPTLFLCGQYDEATPQSTQYFSELVHDSKFKVIKQASHAILSEKPDALIGEIRDFLGEIEVCS